MGFGIIGVFAVAWALSCVVYKAKGFDRSDVPTAT